MKIKNKTFISLLVVLLIVAVTSLYFLVRRTPEGTLKNNRSFYNIDAYLNSDKKTISAKEIVKLRNNYNSPLKALVFHLYADSYNSAETEASSGSTRGPLTEEEKGDINITSVKVNNIKKSYSDEKQILKISLDKPLKPGEIAEVQVDFSVKLPMDKLAFGYYSDQYSIVNWYPILSMYDEKAQSWDENVFYPIGESNYSDCADYKIELNVPKGMVVAATGIETAKKEDDKRNKLTFEAEKVRDFAFFASKEYKIVSKVVEGIKVNSYYFDEDSSAKRMLDLACKSIEFYNKTFGKYPYNQYNIVETYYNNGAMEYPCIAQMSRYQKLSEDYANDLLTYFDLDVVHETGHQWFYSAVGNDEFKEPVLDESFTSYVTALFYENTFGKYGALAVKASFLKTPIHDSDPIVRAVNKYSSNSEYVKLIYYHAPVVLEDFRQRVGSEKLIEVFKDYYEKYKFKNATFEGFLEVVKAHCGSENSDFLKKSLTSGDYSMDRLILSQDELSKIPRSYVY